MEPKYDQMFFIVKKDSSDYSNILHNKKRNGYFRNGSQKVSLGPEMVLLLVLQSRDTDSMSFAVVHEKFAGNKEFLFHKA